MTIHCGSRNLGVKVANHWHNIAQNSKRAQFVSFLWGEALKGYLSDMVIAQAYALYNHQIIRDRIFAILKKLCIKSYISQTEKNIESVTNLRQKYRNKLRNCKDDNLMEEYKEKRNECTTMLNIILLQDLFFFFS